MLVISCGADGRVLVSDSKRPSRNSADIEELIEPANPKWFKVSNNPDYVAGSINFHNVISCLIELYYLLRNIR
jgi:hypothetical protein